MENSSQKLLPTEVNKHENIVDDSTMQPSSMAEVSKAQEAPDNASVTSAPRIEDAHPEYEEI
eukprot:6400728-Ditylum_brightwellii.AAC.1